MSLSASAPGPKPAPLWWQREPWRRRAAALFRRYALRRDYRVAYRPGIGTARIDRARKVVEVDPHFPPVHPLARHRPRRRREGYLRAYLAHEAAHARYTTAALPPGLLGQVVNMLEDERIERLLAREVEGAAELFDFVGDQLLLGGAWRGDALEGALAWRWQHDCPHPVWASADPRWPRVRALVERAWTAPDTRAVIEIAREIFRELGLHEDSPAREWAVPVHPPSGRADEPEEPPDGGGGEGGGPLEGAPQPDEGVLPDDEEDLEEDYARGAWEVEGPARELSKLLRAEAPRARAVPARSRGRFEYGRWAQGRERPFLHKQQPRPRPARSVGLLLDASGSMDGERWRQAVRLAFLLARAAELAGVPFRAWAFQERPCPLGEGREAAVEAARLRPCWGTRVLPALLAGLRAAPDLLFVVSDGLLEPEEAGPIRRELRRAGGTLAVPVLVGAEAEAEDYREAFGRLLQAKDPAELPTLVRAWLTARLGR